RGIIEVLPPGWQYPHDCQARILFENLTIQPPDFQTTRWVQKADIVVQGETLGAVEVFYLRDLPRSDEGPFLKEERKLIGTIAERIASSVTQRRLRAAFEGWAAADQVSAQGDWRVVLEFLRETDPALLKRLSRIRRLFCESLDLINIAKRFIEVKDFYDLLGKVIFPPGCHGKLGRKSAGLSLAKKIIYKAPESSALLREVKVPRPWYLTSDWIQDFVHHNDLEDVLNRKYMEIDQVRQEYPHLVALFKRSSFPSEFA